MNPDNYPIETRSHSVSWNNAPTWGYYWRGVRLGHRNLWLFEDWLSLEVNIAQNDRYPDAPFPLATRNFQRIRDAEPVRWNYAHICFLQAQARKIQKWWNNTPQTAVPVSEEAVHEDKSCYGTEMAQDGCDVTTGIPPTLVKGGDCIDIVTDYSSSDDDDDDC